MPSLLRLAPLALMLPVAAAVLPPARAAGPAHVTINADQVLLIDGKKVFPVGFTTPPPPDGKTPSGKNGIQELHDAGATFLRTGAKGGVWNDAAFAQEQAWEDAAARHGMHTWLYLGKAAVDPAHPQNEATLRRVVERFRNHPGLGVWKGEDEPEWGKVPVEAVVRAREAVRKLDAHHPLTIIQAPRGTVESLRPYGPAGEIHGMDVYPISYPPGIHSLLPNKEISMVGDYTRMMQEVVGRKKPVWMVLQIAWSGVVKPGKTLRFPTFPEERFMTYQAIINGARGLVYFGGNVEAAMTEEDRKLGWNWRFWNRVLRPVVEEIGEKSPLYPALTAPDSTLPVRVSGSDGIEYCVREAGDDLFVLACKREGVTAQVEWSGLPSGVTGGEVLYEEPRTVTVKDGRFTDWFAPHDVHVYRFHRTDRR